ncbi:hypothetical protein LAC03_01610 [Levilactobacillus acidifarinae]|nr:hypothetical protein LAC03_01610 [Levilactobacillus acidifarinae]
MTGHHRISHAKFLQIYNSWARYYRLNTPTKPVSTKTTQKLKAAPKILQGYWRDGDDVVHVTKHKVISVANYPHKGNRPVVIKAEWSTGEEPHTYYHTEIYDGIRGNYPIFVYKISRNSYRSTKVLHNQFTSTSHRISHAQYNRLCKAWIK